MTKLEELKKHLRAGRVYRREELVRWSKTLDRHLRALVSEGTLTKLARGLYACPKQTIFGKAPPEDDKLVKAFLKDGHFLVTSPNAYNGLGVGTTQLYNRTVVYNHKRHGQFSLGARTFDFRVKASFPKSLSREFLLVDLINNLDQLAESREEVLARVTKRVSSFHAERLRHAVHCYGNGHAKKFLFQALKTLPELHVG
jgi:hypothetical protein